MKHRHQPPVVALRSVAQQVVDLDPQAPDFALRLKNLQDSARAALLEAMHLTPGNPRIKNAQAISAASRKQKAEALRAEILPILAELRGQGYQSYAELANGLNQRNIKPPRSDAWSAATVHALENPRHAKS